MKYYIKARKAKWKKVDEEIFNEYVGFLKSRFDEVGAKKEVQRKEFLSRYTKVKENEQSIIS